MMSNDQIQMAIDALVASERELRLYADDAHCEHDVGVCSCEYYRVRKLNGLALSALRQHQQDGGWRSIETAPKDGTPIFVWTGNAEFPMRLEASWREPTEREYWVSGSDEPEPGDGTFGPEEGWFDECGFAGMKLDGESYPTKWQPLPPAPKKENDDDSDR